MFSNHSLDNHPRILDAIEHAKPNVVAVELVGEDPEYRVAMEREVNAQLVGAAPTPEVEIGWFEEDFIARFKGTDIRYILTDISSEARAWEYHLSSIRHLQEYERQSDGMARYHSARLFLEHSALSMAWREQHTADSLARLAHENSGKRIVAVLGMMHTGMRRYLAPGIVASRQFINTIGEETQLAPGQKARFNAHEAGRRAYLAGVMSIDEMVAHIVDAEGRIRDYQGMAP